MRQIISVITLPFGAEYEVEFPKGDVLRPSRDTFTPLETFSFWLSIEKLTYLNLISK
jgi:hypothetical protein